MTSKKNSKSEYDRLKNDKSEYDLIIIEKKSRYFAISGGRIRKIMWHAEKIPSHNLILCFVPDQYKIGYPE